MFTNKPQLGLIFSQFQVHQRVASGFAFFSVACPPTSRNWVRLFFLSCKFTNESQLCLNFFFFSVASPLTSRNWVRFFFGCMFTNESQLGSILFSVACPSTSLN